MQIPSKEEIERRKAQYVGKRIEVVRITDDPDPLKPGEQGDCYDVDAMGQLLVNWDNGRTLSLIPGVDYFRIPERR